MPFSDAPVTPIPGDRPEARPERGIALCLSGGGYRAMLFHLGSLRRLNEAALLARVERVSSVSGGSITAAALGRAWSALDFDGRGVARRFDEEVARPVHALASRTLDRSAIAAGVLLPGSVGDRLAAAYRKHLLGDATLQDLPDRPRFVLNATSVQSGVLFRFSKPYCWDYRVGKIPSPSFPLAVAVAASSAFPPVLSPVTLDVRPADFEPGTGHDLQRPPFTEKVVLSDGGVYDNLGLETAWKRYQTLLVSDGGGQMQAEEKPARDWARHGVRVLGVIDNQVRSLRRRQLLDSYTAPKDAPNHRDGCYWGIRTNIASYALPAGEHLPCPHAATLELAAEPTRLRALSEVLQKRLVNWGYAVCDAALRRHLLPDLPRPAGFPHPEAGIGEGA